MTIQTGASTVFTLTKESKSFKIEPRWVELSGETKKSAKSGGLRTTKIIQNLYPSKGKLTGFIGNTIYSIMN